MPRSDRRIRTVSDSDSASEKGPENFTREKLREKSSTERGKCNKAGIIQQKKTDATKAGRKDGKMELRKGYTKKRRNIRESSKTRTRKKCGQPTAERVVRLDQHMQSYKHASMWREDVPTQRDQDALSGCPKESAIRRDASINVYACPAY